MRLEPQPTIAFDFNPPRGHTKPYRGPRGLIAPTKPHADRTDVTQPCDSHSVLTAGNLTLGRRPCALLWKRHARFVPAPPPPAWRSGEALDAGLHEKANKTNNVYVGQPRIIVRHLKGPKPAIVPPGLPQFCKIFPFARQRLLWAEPPEGVGLRHSTPMGDFRCPLIRCTIWSKNLLIAETS